VAALLAAALAERDSWDALLPDGGAVSVRQIADAGRLLAHPLARRSPRAGVPLGSDHRFGSGSEHRDAVHDQRTCTSAPGRRSRTAIQDDFAPAQFFELTERRSWRARHSSGTTRRAGGGEPRPGDDRAPVAIKTTEYETFYIDEPGGGAQDPVRVKPPLGDLVVLLPSAPQAGDDRKAPRRYQAGQSDPVAEPAFVVDKSTLQSSGIACGRATVSKPAPAHRRKSKPPDRRRA